MLLSAVSDMAVPFRPLRPLLGLAAALAPAGPLSAAEFTAEAVDSGVWQDPKNWAITPAGSLLGYPHNTGGEIYDVSIPSGGSFDLNADVTVRSLTSAAGFTIQNAANRNFAIEGDAVLGGGTLNTQSSIRFITRGVTTLDGIVSLNNGASVLNQGTIFVDDAALGSLEADLSLRDLGYTLRNEGGITFDRPGSNVLQNYVTQNVGAFEVLQGTVDHTTSYVQTAGETRVADGAQLRSNALVFSGGTVLAAGNGLNGSNVRFNGGTLEIGPAVDAAGALTISGNINGPHTGGVFQFDLGGTAQGVSHDLLTLPNGMNFGEITLLVGLVDGFSPAPSDVFRIITGNNLNGTFLNESGGLLDVPGVGAFTVTHAGTFVELGDFVPIPEPGVLPLAGLGALAWFAARRRSQA